MFAVFCEICGFNSWPAHKSDRVIAFRLHETPVLILAQCRAQERPARRPDEEFAPDAATVRKSCRPGKRPLKRRASRTGSCCFRRGKRRAADSACPNAFADRA